MPRSVGYCLELSWTLPPWRRLRRPQPERDHLTRDQPYLRRFAARLCAVVPAALRLVLPKSFLDVLTRHLIITRQRQHRSQYAPSDLGTLVIGSDQLGLGNARLGPVNRASARSVLRGRQALSTAINGTSNSLSKSCLDLTRRLLISSMVAIPTPRMPPATMDSAMLRRSFGLEG